ncbi:hypothetical protein [Streptomyces sp. NPDC004533]|uniref:hypothetical protein n=1 Tax=Streptomyces sp. NPDC004533 TaxID=3154278 RepID=UPI0033BD6538
MERPFRAVEEPVRAGRAVGARSLELPVLDGVAAGVGLAGESGEPVQVLRCVHPRRRVGCTALQALLGRRGLLMGVDGGAPLRRGERGVPSRVVDGVRRGRHPVAVVVVGARGDRRGRGRGSVPCGD